MEGADLFMEIVKRARAGFVYSEAVARYMVHILILFSLITFDISLE